MIDPAHSALKRVCRDFAVPGEAICPGWARVVLSFWNYEERRVAGCGGAAWVRRQWEHAPEPTVLLGFDSQADFRVSPEGSLLDLAGIVYVELPVAGCARDIMQSAIDMVRACPIGALDGAATARNADDFANALLDWRHTFKSFRIQIRNGSAKTAPGRTAEESARECGILSGLGHDSIDRWRRTFLHKTEGCDRHGDKIGGGAAHVAAILTAASATWGQVIDIIAPPEEAQAARAHPLLTKLLVELDAIDTAVAEIVCHLSALSSRLRSQQGDPVR